MENRIAAGNIEIRHTAIHFAEVLAVGHDLLHLFPRHAVQLLAGILRKDIAVLAPLVAVVCDMPLKSKILFHDRMPLCFRIAPTEEAAGAQVGQKKSYLSAAPQAAPQAAGFFSSSAGLSAAPQAAPQAAEGAICTFQEARFFRAICSSSLSEFGTVFRGFMVNAVKQQNKYALFY